MWPHDERDGGRGLEQGTIAANHGAKVYTGNCLQRRQAKNDYGKVVNKEMMKKYECGWRMKRIRFHKTMSIGFRTVTIVLTFDGF